MKIKKFNWVDGVILLMILLAVGVVLGRNVLFDSTSITESISGQKELIVKAKAASVPMAVVEAFVIGDAPMAGGRELKGEVLEVTYSPSSVFEIRDGQVVVTTREDYYDLQVTFRVTANSYAYYMEHGGQELKVGLSYFIKTRRAEAFGYITGIEILE